MESLLTQIQNTFNGKNKKEQKKMIRKQQLNKEEINELLEQATQSIMCGPSCQKMKVTNELHQNYLDAETNLQTAPIQVEETKKKYYVYSEGETYYNDMMETELKEKANKIASKIKTNFNEEINGANTMNSFLNTEIVNSEYTKELLEEFIIKNKRLKEQLKDSRGDILTNDRKTYYETEAFNKLKSWYTFFWYIYYVLTFVLILSLFLSPNDLSKQKKIIISILVFFFPYYIHYIVNRLNHLWNSVTSSLPKNVYNNL